MAQQYRTQIISADSRQCYRELNIGVAKPSSDELAVVPHYFINSHSIFDEVNAGVFENYALQKLDEIFVTNDVAIVVGGTGLYINALCNGIDEMPDIPTEIRERIISDYNVKGLLWLQQQLQEKDQLFWRITNEQQNPQRLMRALEIKEATGKSINEFRTQKKVERPFSIIKMGLQLPKEDLHKNINTRVDQMVNQGLIDEVEQLIPYKNLNALQTVGYTELFQYFNNEISRSEAIELIKTHTRQYAKRQLTWFKRDENIKWVSPTIGIEKLEELI